MKYSMTTPCPQCPFRNDIKGYLHPDRVEEIAESVLRQQSFPCHKTTTFEDCDDENEGYERRVNEDDEEQCAGAEIFAMKNGTCSQMRRIVGLKRDAERYRWLRSAGLHHINFHDLTPDTCDVGLDAAIDAAMAKHHD